MNKTFWAFLSLALITVALVVSVYVSHWGLHPSDSHGIWAEFGDFVGGVLNPILSFFAFVALLYTIRVQVAQLQTSTSELKLSGEQFQLSNRLTQEQITQAETLSNRQLQADAEHRSKELQVNTIFHVLNEISHQLDAILEIKFASNPGRDRSKSRDVAVARSPSGIAGKRT